MQDIVDARRVADLHLRQQVDRRLPRQRIVADRELDGLQPPDLVAQPSRLLEFEVAGGFLHLLLEFGRHRECDLARQPLALELRTLGLFAARNEIEDVAHFFTDRFWFDPVL